MTNKINIYADNDANYKLAFQYDPANDMVEGEDYYKNYFELKVDKTGTGKSAEQALQENPLGTNAPKKTVVIDGSNETRYDGHRFDFKEKIENSNASGVNIGDLVKITNEDGSVFTYVKEAATAVIDGVGYVLNNIAEGITSAATALGEFIVEQVSEFGEWFFNEKNFYDYFSTFLNLNRADIVSGNLSAINDNFLLLNLQFKKAM